MMAGEILYGVSSTLVKASLLAMIRRLLANSNQKLLIRFVLVCDVLNLAAGISWTFVAVFQCRLVINCYVSSAARILLLGSNLTMKP